MHGKRDVLPTMPEKFFLVSGTTKYGEISTQDAVREPTVSDKQAQEQSLRSPGTAFE